MRLPRRRPLSVGARVVAGSCLTIGYLGGASSRVGASNSQSGDSLRFRDRPVLPVSLTRVDDRAPQYATFQSHNQKVVENRFGIFLTYLDKITPVAARCPHPPMPPCYDSPYQWKLLRSRDAGTTFDTVFKAIGDTRAPSLETDARGDLYLIAQDYSPEHGDAFLYRFTSENGFTTPVITRIANGGTGKGASYLDQGRRQLYYMTNGGTATDFYVFDFGGKLLRSTQLVRNGPSAVLQFPYLAMNGPTLYVAWTTYLLAKSLYWDIHFIRSDDGGSSWKKATTADLLSLPVVADQTGNADSLVMNDEYGSQVWLSNVIGQDGYLHFMYEAQLPATREHYVRYNAQRQAIDVNLYPRWGGKDLAIQSLDGFFAADTGSSPGLLYAISTNNADSTGHRLVVLASADSGRNWFDYAASRPFSRPYSIGGARIARAGGRIIGTFTDLVRPDSGAAANVNEVWFFRVDAR